MSPTAERRWRHARHVRFLSATPWLSRCRLPLYPKEHANLPGEPLGGPGNRERLGQAHSHGLNPRRPQPRVSTGEPKLSPRRAKLTPSIQSEGRFRHERRRHQVERPGLLTSGSDTCVCLLRRLLLTWPAGSDVRMFSANWARGSCLSRKPDAPSSSALE
jgi:hypothetical protein